MPHDVLHSNSVIIHRTIHNSMMFFNFGFAIVQQRLCLDSWSEEFVIVQEEVVLPVLHLKGCDRIVVKLGSSQWVFTV